VCQGRHAVASGRDTRRIAHAPIGPPIDRLVTEVTLDEASGAIDILPERHNIPLVWWGAVGFESPAGLRAVGVCASESLSCESPTGLRARFLPAH
jgi:hypothetical protein